jgi:hypothetical protein
MRKKRAEDATVLLLAKDRLNDLARPARGRSVAYTTMFSNGTPWFFRSRTPSRYDLALGAYPEIVRHVHVFKFIYWLLLLFGVFWLLATWFSYSDVALGSAILRNIGIIETERENFLKANPSLLPCALPEPGTASQGTASQGTASSPGGAYEVSCQRLKQLSENENIAAADAIKYHKCANDWWNVFVVRCWSVPRLSLQDIYTVLHAAWPALHHGEGAPQPPDSANVGVAAQAGHSGPAIVPPGNVSDIAGQQHRLAETTDIAASVSVFSTYILPTMFGVLETLVAAFRLLHDNTRDNLLSPRDLLLILTSLPIGVIAGLAVGLFFRASEGTVTGLSGLPTAISLSVAGLAFLAGYAADAFFSFLDSIRSQIFRATNPPPGSDAAMRRTERATPVTVRTGDATAGTGSTTG